MKVFFYVVKKSSLHWKVAHGKLTVLVLLPFGHTHRLVESLVGRGEGEERRGGGFYSLSSSSPQMEEP